jgi:hypothetical protein
MSAQTKNARFLSEGGRFSLRSYFVGKGKYSTGTHA